MSFLDNHSLNPHLHLFVLNKAADVESNEHRLVKIGHLAKTRLFDMLLSESKHMQGHNFPTLEKKIAEAREKSALERKSLHENNIKQFIDKLDKKSKVADENDQQVDEGQIGIYRYAKILFDEGKYSASLDILTQLQKQQLKDDLWLKSTWAILYCQILLQDPGSKRTAVSLKSKIDELEQQELKALEKNKQKLAKAVKKYYAIKEQFLILCTVVYFRESTNEDLQKYVEICTTDKKYFSVMQLVVPELLRYICTAIILHKGLQNNRAFDLFKLVEVINRKIVKYRDPFIEFLQSLYIDYDFEIIAKRIEEIHTAVKTDVFLKALAPRIVESCQFLYYKVSCKVYETIPLADIARFTNKSQQQAELWMLKYIRSTDIDAKIDQIAGIIVTNRNKVSPTEKYVEIIPNMSTFINSLSRAIESH